MMNENNLTFCGKKIGEGYPPFIVAEVGFNHNGEVELAKEMIKAAADNGADAVKLQTFLGEEMFSKLYRRNDPDNPENEIPIYQFYKRYELTKEDYQEIIRFAEEQGIPLFSTPFDEKSLDLIVELGMPAIKIASCDLTNLPFLKLAAQKKLPIVLSCGMGTMGEIELALETIFSEDNEEVILLYCVSNYPAEIEETDINSIKTLQSAFKVPIGFSDHTMGNLSAIVSATVGAVMIEKHFTSDRGLPGVDQSISMEPAELKELKETTINVMKLLGSGKRELRSSEKEIKKIIRRSLVAKCDIKKGEKITRDMLSIKRPETGISPTDFDRVLGREARTDILAEEVLTWEMV